jgi:hypothetical protein
MSDGGVRLSLADGVETLTYAHRHAGAPLPSRGYGHRLIAPTIWSVRVRPAARTSLPLASSVGMAGRRGRVWPTST